MASVSPRGLRRYRWRELWLLIIPFMILVLEMAQLLIVQSHQSSLHQSTIHTNQLSIRFTVHDLIPVFGLIAALCAVYFLLSIFLPMADQGPFPLVGLTT